MCYLSPENYRLYASFLTTAVASGVLRMLFCALYIDYNLSCLGDIVHSFYTDLCTRMN